MPTVFSNTSFSLFKKKEQKPNLSRVEHSVQPTRQPIRKEQTYLASSNSRLDVLSQKEKSKEYAGEIHVPLIQKETKENPKEKSIEKSNEKTNAHPTHLVTKEEPSAQQPKKKSKCKKSKVPTASALTQIQPCFKVFIFTNILHGLRGSGYAQAIAYTKEDAIKNLCRKFLWDLHIIKKMRVQYWNEIYEYYNVDPETHTWISELVKISGRSYAEFEENAPKPIYQINNSRARNIVDFQLSLEQGNCQVLTLSDLDPNLEVNEKIRDDFIRYEGGT